MLKELKELWSYRELLYVMVQRELRIRYKNSALGVVWSFLNPIFQVLIMSLVFGTFMEIKIPNYTAYMLSAYLPFMFFQYSVLDAAQSILVQVPLIKKIYFPREILPLATVISNFIHLLIGLLIFFGYMLIVYIRDPRVWPFHLTILYLPVLLLFSLMLATGASLIISALNTFFEDVKYIVNVVMQVMFYLCPIIYFEEMVANNHLNLQSNWLLYKLYNLNPLAALSHGYRRILLAKTDVTVHGDTAKPLPMELVWKYLLVSGVVSFVVLVFGYWLFNRLKWKFVERP
ncbi:MAG: hypothetical protein GC165_13750 [Armatimonadetes bacterium]|nr:hypothetical protein [Armatimonadota bacterium]MBS1725861.1 ABC transporter permease [Armatimonadota bacterium]